MLLTGAYAGVFFKEPITDEVTLGANIKYDYQATDLEKLQLISLELNTYEFEKFLDWF